MNQDLVISYRCRNSTIHIIHTDGRKIRNLPVSVVEILTIRNALKMVIQEKYPNTIIESDQLIIIHAINGNSKPPSQLCYLVEDIIILTRIVDNIRFVYCNKFVNELLDKIARVLSCL